MVKMKTTTLYLFLMLMLLFGFYNPIQAQHHHINTIHSVDVPIEKIKNECKFFSGDTLNGFPLEATIEVGIKKFDIYSELKWYVNTKEIEFIKSKYNITTLPQEIISGQRTHTVATTFTTNPACNNIDFEAGTFGGWTGGIGYNSNSNTALTVTSPVITTLGMNSIETSCSFHTLMTAAGGTDPWGGFPVVDPGGGTYAVRLGGEVINTNDQANNAGCTVNHPSANPNYFSNGESLQQTFLVTPNNTLLTYNYAVILEKAPHTNGQQPYFRVEVLDQTNAEIPCLNYYVQGDSAGTYPPGFIDEGGAEALPWQQSSLNLLPYLGQNITVRFTAAGCIPGGHFGYGYVDCACAPLEIIIPTFACQGGIDSLIAPPVAGSTYAWTGPGITSGTTSQVITANTGGTYSVTITNALGCSYTLDTTIVFHPNPTVTVNSPTICTGATTTLTAASTGSAGTLTYAWNPAAGLTFSPGDSVATITPPASATFTVTGTSVQGCTNTAVANITVNGSAPPTFNAPPVCLGATTMFTNTTVGGSTFDWNFGDATNPADTSQLQNPTYTYPTAGNFAVNFTVTTASGCKSNTTQTITVSPLPTASFSAPPVCLGSATVFTSTINPTVGSTYMWNYGDGPAAAGSATPSHTYATTNTFVVTLTVTAAGSCTVTATNSVVVNQIPTAAFNVAAVCMGTGSVFNNTSTLDSACAWNFGGAGNPATANSICAPTFTYSASGTFPVTLTVTAIGGCTATATGNAVVNPFPVLGFTANHPCVGAPVNFVNTTTNQATISNWSWNFGDGSAPNTNATPAPYTYTAPAGVSAAGCYSVVLTATASTGCSGSHDTIVYVHNNPFAFFKAWEACLGSPSEFVDSSFVQNPACLNDHITSWIYDFGDGTTTPYTSANLPDTIKHTYAVCGPYNITATVTTNNGCTFSNTLPGDTVFCIPTVVGPVNFTVCPSAATPVQTFTTTCANGGTPTAQWFQSMTNINNTGAPPNFLNPGGFDQVPTYNVIAQNLSCGLLKDTVFAFPISGFGCVGTPTYYIANVYPTPTVTPVSSVTVCPSVIVPAFNFTGCPGTPAETYSWTTAGNNVGIATPSPGLAINAFTSQNTTDLVAVGTVSVTPLANGCVGSGTTFSVTVNPTPSMTVTSPAPYCPDALISSTDYNITTDPAIPGVTYTWTANNNVGTGMPLTGTGAAPNAAYNAPANASLVNQVSIISYTPSLNGCIGIPVTESVTIKPTPVVDPVPPSFYCPNQVTNQINFTCQPTGGTPIFTYTVPGGFGQTGTGNLPPFTTVNPGTTNIVTTFTVNATLNNCLGPNSTFIITVHPNPKASFIYKPLVCEGSPMFFTDESVAYGGLTINSWQWDMDNNGSIDVSVQNPQYVIPTVGLDSVTLYVATSSVPSCTAHVTEPVFVNPIPVPQFVGFNLQGCPTLQTAFTDQSTISSGHIVSWNWNFGNGQAFSGQFPPPQDYPNTSPTTPAFYSASLTVKSDSGCVASKIKNNYMEVYPRPIANFSWGPGDADIDAPVITFVNEAIGASEYLPTQTYGQYGVEYYLGDTYASGTSPNYVHNNTSFNHSYNDPDANDVTETYYVTQWVINSYGCTDSITKPVEILPIFTFYIPNAFTPNSDGKNEGFKGLGIGIDNTTYNLWVFDRWGLMIYHATDIDKAWDGHMRGDESKPILQEDVYVWKVKFNDIFGKLHEYHGTVTLVK